MYDLIIIGGGPAGITAGIYSARLSLKTLLIAKTFGGQVSNKAVAIENWPGTESIQGPDLVKKMENHLKGFDTEIKTQEVFKIEKKDDNFIVSTKEDKYESRSVAIATGSKYRNLNVPGEKEFTGRGVSICSVCDGPLFKNKIVAVIGGGNAGFETASYLTDIAKKIYILEFSDSSKAFPHIQESVLSSEKVEVITQAKVKEIKGDKFVNSVVFDRNEKEEILEVQGVFVEVGYVPVVPEIGDLVELNEAGEIKVEYETMQTKTPGLFAAGDVNAGQFKQIVIAAGEGAKAVLSAHNFIKHKKIEK